MYILMSINTIQKRLLNEILRHFESLKNLYGRSIKDVNYVKFDPTLIRVAATKYPAKYVLWGLFTVTRRGLEESVRRDVTKIPCVLKGMTS